MVDTSRIKGISEIFESRLIEYRRFFHQHAELSFEERETAAFIREKLREWDIPCKEGITGNSTVAYIDNGKPGPSIGFRADIDALPITESNGLSYASQNKGVMHACGHDAHTAILLTLAQVFSENRDLINGKVSFIFQQGEEKLPGGATQIIADGGLEGIDVLYALHTRTNLNVGQFEAAPGIRSSAIHAYEAVIEGKSGHTGFPHLAADSVNAAAAMVNELNQYLAQCVNPRDTATIAVAYMHTDNENIPNVFAKSIRFGGTIRSLSNDLWRSIPEMMEKRLQNICDMRGCKGSFHLIPGYPAVVNEGNYYAHVSSAGLALGYENVSTDDVLGGEDFSYMLLQVPGAYFTVGFRDPDRPETGGARHTANLLLDERGLRVGLELMLGAYLDTVEDQTR